MNVLYILGNGFDLQIGLPTAYSDFYQYYVSLESKSDSIKQLKEAIKGSPKDWSDLEMALGKYTAETKTSQEYCEAYDDLQTALRDYILKVDEMMKSGELVLNANSKTLERGFSFPERIFSSDVAYTIEGEFNRLSPGLTNGQSLYNANILSFNYTHVVEHHLKKVMEDHVINRMRYLNSVQHIHREVRDTQSIWVGVDNEEQIAHERYRANPDVQYRLLKPKIISALSRRMVEDAKMFIRSADVLVIFGASLGPSDMTWAQQIANKLTEGTVALLFVHNGKTYPSDNAKLIDQEKCKSDFIEKMKGYGANIPDDSRIFVEINSSIFTDGTPNGHDANLKLVLDRLKG